MADDSVNVFQQQNDPPDHEETKESLQQQQRLLSEHNDKQILEDTECGLGIWKPKWLQLFASKKSYIVAYSALGIYEASVNSYFTGTISSMEKRFRLPSTATGIISGGWDVGTVCGSIMTAYLGHNIKHKTKWVSAGLLLMSLGCLMHYSPHIFYGPGEVIGNISEGDNLCNKTKSNDEHCTLNSEGTVTFIVLLTAHIMLGLGSSAYYTLGSAYLDDNVKKNKFPFIIGLISAIYYIGPALGLLLASYTVSIYINPDYTPDFGEDDPRWIGAWQIGWLQFVYYGFIVSLIMSLFPRMLPREAERRKKLPEIIEDEPEETLFNDFKKTLIRLSKNSVLTLNTVSFTLYIFGTSGFWIFLPKYIEAQFRKTPSEASIVTGAVGLLCTSCGYAIGGMIISKFKPSSRFLAAWCVVTEILEMLSFICYAYLGCFREDLHGNLKPDGSWNLETSCNMDCNCSPTMEYSPVCSMDQTMTFYSSCHAGCMTSNLMNNTKIYGNCSCIGGTQWATDGACPSDCGTDYIIFILILFTVELVASTGRPANTLIQFRAVEPKDKATMLALSEVLMSGLGWVPGPVFYGIILDASCLVWEVSCGETGNCWFYDGQKMRFLLNYTAAGFVLLAILLDIGVLLKIGQLPMYDEDIEYDKKQNDDKVDDTRWRCKMDLRMLPDRRNDLRNNTDKEDDKNENEEYDPEKFKCVMDLRMLPNNENDLRNNTDKEDDKNENEEYDPEKFKCVMDLRMLPNNENDPTNNTDKNKNEEYDPEKFKCEMDLRMLPKNENDLRNNTDKEDDKNENEEYDPEKFKCVMDLRMLPNNENDPTNNTDKNKNEEYDPEKFKCEMDLRMLPKNENDLRNNTDKEDDKNENEEYDPEKFKCEMDLRMLPKKNTN